MIFAANYAASSYGAVTYGLRAAAVYPAAVVENATVSNEVSSGLLEPVIVFVAGRDNRNLPVGQEKRNFTL